MAKFLLPTLTFILLICTTVADETKITGLQTFISHNLAFVTINCSDGYNGTKGTSYEVEVMIPVDHNADTNGTRYGTSGSVMNFAQMANEIATQITNTASFPTWNSQTGINTVFAKVVDNNRIQLVSDVATQNQFKFSNQGTAPIKIETDQTSGVVDDYYNITGVTSTTVSITSNIQIAPRVLEFNSQSGIATYGGVVYINIPNGHGLSDGQKVVYNKTAGNDLGGVSSGTTYFAIVAGPYDVGLATNTESWQSGINGITTGATSGTGSYNLTINSIGGRVAAAGTIGITSTTSTVVDGYDTRFSSNYSQGDRI